MEGGGGGGLRTTCCSITKELEWTRKLKVCGILEKLQTSVVIVTPRKLAWTSKGRQSPWQSEHLLTTCCSDIKEVGVDKEIQDLWQP